MGLKAWQIAMLPGLLFLFALYYDEISAFFTASAEEAATTETGSWQQYQQRRGA